MALITNKHISEYCRECTSEPTISLHCIAEAERFDIIPQIGVRLFRRIDEYQSQMLEFDSQKEKLEKDITKLESDKLKAEDRYNHNKITVEQYEEELELINAKIDDIKADIVTIDEQKDAMKDDTIEFILEGGYYEDDTDTDVVLNVPSLKAIEAYYSAYRISRSGNDQMTRYGLVVKQDVDSQSSGERRVANYSNYLKQSADLMMAELKQYLRLKRLTVSSDSTSNGSILPTITVTKIGD